MKKYGLLGEKLSHSYSPTIHNFIFESLNIEASYTLLEVKEEELNSYIEALRNNEYHGFNVTIPYKKTILKYLDFIDAKAETIGSVNTVYLKDGKVCGTNTDYDGFLETIVYHNLDVKHKICYILGTGGASLAVRQVIQDLQGIPYSVSRTPKGEQISYQELEEKEIDLLINTTPVGMYPNLDVSPVSKDVARKAKEVIDIIFNPQQTQLLKDAESDKNGLHMLIMQAIRAESIWQQKEIQISISDLLENLEWMMCLPQEIIRYVQSLKFKKDPMGWSEDDVYLFEDKYVLKVSLSKENLLREKTCVDWLEDKIPGSKSIAFIEKDSKAYYLRTKVQGINLADKTFLDQPNHLIQALKGVISTLRSLDALDCPFYSKDNSGKLFVHGDLCLPNILVNPQGEFLGFIDLDNAGLGDAWYDYAWLLWSFEYNLKTNQFNQLLLKELGIEMDEEKYHTYIPQSYIDKLKSENA